MPDEPSDIPELPVEPIEEMPPPRMINTSFGHRVGCCPK